MNELSLFSGAGGSLLATKHLLKWRTVGYVEFNKYCQQVLAQRIKEEFLDEAPIFGDINGFIESGAVDEYRGVAEVVSGGFPCQPFSVAGRGAGEDDPRNMWPQTIEVIRRVRPRFAFLENVPGLFSHEYIGRIFGDLAEAGYDAKWTVLGADDVGAPHRRKRVWILAYPNGPQRTRGGVSGRIQEELSHPGGASWWEVEPNVGRVANGVASWMDRLRATGNGQVPGVAATAWELLSGQELEKL